MERAQKGPITLIAATLLAGLLVLSACDSGPATPTPIQAPAATNTPAQPALEADATLFPLPTSTEIAPPPVLTIVVEGTPTAVAEGTLIPSDFVGETVADIGFRANPNGFSFENYAGKKLNGKPVRELLVDDLQQMFGDSEVCVKIVNGVCTPRQEALDWLEMLTNDPPGGHCEGMAVSSLLLFKELDSPSNYGEGAETTFDLEFTPEVQKLIAYYYYLQYIDPVSSEYSLAEQFKPSEVLQQVIDSMQDGAPDPVNLGFYGGDPDDNGNISGHSITPYSVEDRGNGIFWIHVYDNNWPDKADVVMEIDTVNETWTYDLSARNPDYEPQVWTGDERSQTLAALPLSWRTGTLICPWCDESEGGSINNVSSKALNALAPGLSLFTDDPATGSSDAQRSSNMQITLQGAGNLLIVNSQGQRLGFDGTTLVREIPGGRVVRPRTGKGPAQPVFFVPKGEAYSITLNGQGVQSGAPATSTVSLFGQGMAVTVKDLLLNTGDQHKLTISADAQDLGFVAGNSATKPTFRISTTVKSGPGVLSGPTSYQFQVGNVDLTEGQQVDFSLDKPTGQFDFKSTGAAAAVSNYDLDIVRTDTAGTQAFKKLGVSLSPSDTHSLNFGDWKTIQQVAIEIDRGSTGQIAERQPVPTAPVPTQIPQP